MRDFRKQHMDYIENEIEGQTSILSSLLHDYLSNDYIIESAFKNSYKLLDQVRHVQLVASGSSYYAGMVAKYWLEELAGIATSVEISSEFYCRKSVVSKNSLFLAIFSDDTADIDTVIALDYAKKMNYLGTLAMGNVSNNVLNHKPDFNFMINKDFNMKFNTTNVFAGQLTALLIFTLILSKHKQVNEVVNKNIIKELYQLPNLITQMNGMRHIISNIAKDFFAKRHAIFLGRNSLYPIALEGALRFKEIAFIHAEGYPAGELKHGPLALVDYNMPVIALLPNNELVDKIKSNLHEILARNGTLYVFSDCLMSQDFQDKKMNIIQMPSVNPILAPIMYVIPLQLLAYQIAFNCENRNKLLSFI